MPAQQDPVELIVAAWPRTAAAERAMHALRVALTPDLAGLHDAAALVVEGDGTTRVTDTRRDSGTIGGVLGAGLGLLTGGIGWMWLHGRRLGALSARAGDGGLAGGALRELGERTMPGSSVVLAVAVPACADWVEGALADRGGDVVRCVLPAPLATLLAAAPPLTFDPAAYQGDVVAFRTAAPVMRAVESVPAPRRAVAPARDAAAV